MAIDETQVSSLLNQIPAVFQEGSEPSKPNFLGRFLLAFERILLGLGETSSEVPEPGLEEILGGILDPVNHERLLAGIDRYFEPGATLEEFERTPSEFLHWLASWVALTLREDWEESRQRELIAKAVQLYQLRGTKRGIEEFLQIYTRLGVEVDELNTPLQIGVHSTVGKDTILGGGAPFFFKVRILLPIPNPSLIAKQKEIATEIVNLQKPAYTYYDLMVETPTFQVGVYSKVGVDTLLG